jgi:hypothetical protein
VRLDPLARGLVLFDVDVPEGDAEVAQMRERVLRVRAPVCAVNFHFHNLVSFTAGMPSIITERMSDAG